MKKTKAKLRKPKLIWLSTCSCPHCKGRGAACMDAFNWIDQRDADHVLRHAEQDMLKYFDELSPEIKRALLGATVNVCSWCAEIWAAQYGVAKAAQLIRDVRFIDSLELSKNPAQTA